MKILLGADPELFVINNVGALISSHDLIPGTKENPHPVTKGAIQVDGVSAEFNIDPSSTVDEFCENIETVKKCLKTYLPEGFGLVAIPTAHFTKEYFNSLPEQARMLGCTADFDAYSGVENLPPETDKPFRTGSGHVHIGWTQYEYPFDPEHFKDCCELAQQLDAVLYPMSLLWDNDDERRELYGKMGAFRPTQYGLEYRCLSNRWTDANDLQQWVFLATQEAVKDFFKDIRYQRATKSQKLCMGIYEGMKPKWEYLVEYHGYMVDMFGMPKLPERFLRE